MYLLLGPAVVHHSVFSQMMVECKNLLAYQLQIRLANVQLKKHPCKIVSNLNSYIITKLFKLSNAPLKTTNFYKAREQETEKILKNKIINITIIHHNITLNT